jgi:hypothetical protein
VITAPVIMTATEKVKARATAMAMVTAKVKINN